MMSDCGGYETLSKWQSERDSGLVKELWLAEGDGIANCYQYGFYYWR
jgi:nuclear transport factor 2 (NTF2) superfamily protein